MPTIKITRRSLAAITPGSKPVTYYDETLKGFGLKVMPSGVQSWIIEYRPGSGGRGVAKKRLKIGSPANMSPEEAREKAGRELARVTLGGNPADERAGERGTLTIAELSKLFIDEHVSEKRKSRTEEAYQSILDLHIIPAIGSTRATMVTEADVSKMHSSVARKLKGKQNDGKTTANRSVSVLSSLYGWAGSNGYVPKGFNPTGEVERYRENKKERFLTSDELTALGEAMEEAVTVGFPPSVDPDNPKAKHTPKTNYKVSPHAVGALRLLMLTGCRLREVLNLRWREVDFERGIAFLSDSKTGEKPVVLSSAALAVIEQLPRVGEYVIAGDDAGTENEKPRSDLKRPWKAISQRAGLKGVRLHDLRHTFASFGIGSGLGLPVIGKLLGHSQASTTQRYAHLDVDPVKRAADQIADKISKAMEGK